MRDAGRDSRRLLYHRVMEGPAGGPSVDYYAAREKWFRDNYRGRGHGNIFTPNGVLSCRDFIPKLRILGRIVERDGNILDLGCGNGLLLKCALAVLKRKLVPYGVDFLEESIRQARERILPGFGGNFQVGNALDYGFPVGFDYIMTDPEHIADDDMTGFCGRCRERLAVGGALMFFIPDDVLPRLESRRLTIEALGSRGLRWLRSGSLLCGYEVKA